MKKNAPESRNSWCVFDLASCEKQLHLLESKAKDPSIWENPAQAQETMRRLAHLQRELHEWELLEQRINDAIELASLEDDNLSEEIEKEVSEITAEIDLRETSALFSGHYDENDAILSIHSGAGGTDSQDWAQMLERMYLRWAERRDFKTEVLDQSEGEEAGIKRVIIAINGSYAYGNLRSEKGVHRLVRLSPFDSAHRRHTSFALVEVYPQMKSDEGIEIKPDDLRIDTYRSAGAGGQNVQKNETAIRITHLPTGIVVTCQNERSQTQNKSNAMRVLKARLEDLKRQEQEAELAKLKGAHISAEWGSQIRSYILHPYQMIKDHRTGYEVGNTSAVLDGELEGFIEAFLRASIGQLH